eukprot:UN10636
MEFRWKTIKETTPHYDAKHTFWVVYEGKKEVYLLPPSHSSLLKHEWMSSRKFNHINQKDEFYETMDPLHNFSENHR